MSACELFSAAAAALTQVCVCQSPAPDGALLHSATQERPLYQRAETAVPIAPDGGANGKTESKPPVRTAPLPAAALTGIGVLGGLMVTAAIRRRKH
jgi:hypothetical protein